ncbi:TetR/AcrR family transcriptional regulator [Paenibacillus piri]|uniref:TetR/AcrR family transcriptional regulator n=1 Tax=Paenibacillus piri TaxID=2547395 RepID=UPI00140541FD|nr:TetR/AcrR family transcriptional regulator [Paenibacillus piri]
MARPREFDEKKALNVALELFWKKGYEATSISDLASKMGINRPSLYSAFGDKRELFEMALNAYQQNYLNKLHDILEKNKSGFRGIEAVFARFVESIRNPAARRGCFFVNSIAELAAQDENIAAKGREFQEKIINMFADALMTGKKHGEIPLDLDIESTSHFLAMSLVGLNVVIKTMPDQSFVRNNVRAILSVIQ